MTLTTLLEKNGDVLYFLCIVYFTIMLFSVRKLWRSKREAHACSISTISVVFSVPAAAESGRCPTHWNMKMILCGSIAFTCFVRSLSFGTLAALAIEHVELGQSPATLPTGISLLSNSEINEIRFYNNAIQALFVTGDCE